MESKYELYKNDCSNNEFIDALEKKLRSDDNFFLYNDYGYRAEKFENRIFQGIINEFFYDDNKEPFKKLASKIKNFIKDKDMGIKFLCWFYGYLNKYRNEYLDKLPEKNRVRYKNMAELGIDFNSLLNFYRGLKLNDCSLDEIEKIKMTILNIVGLNTEDNIGLFKDFSNAIENKNHAFDNEFIRLLYISFNPGFMSGMFLKNNKGMGDDIIMSSLDKDQNIDFEFLMLAKEIFYPGDKGIKELIRHFDNRAMPIDYFYGYFRLFLKPDITPKNQVQQIIKNLGEKYNKVNVIFCSDII